MGYLKFQSTHFHCVYFYLDRWICILSFARYDYLQVCFASDRRDKKKHSDVSGSTAPVSYTAGHSIAPC